MNQTTNLYLAHLLGCALEGLPPMPISEGVQWDALLEMAEYHSVAATAYPALATLDVPAHCLAKWTECYQKSLVRALTFQDARAEIFDRFEEENIRYLPMKGIVLEEYYPKIGMRTFCDNDILVDKSNAGRIHGLLTSLGYHGHIAFGSTHDTYQKAPILYMEMHKALFIQGTTHASYWRDIWQRAQQVDGCQYAMSNEDYYLYFLAHFHKHFADGGCGIRALVDNQQLIRHLGYKLNWKYVDLELEKMGLTDFYEKTCDLTRLLFQNPTVIPKLNDSMMSLFTEMMAAGTYGTQTKQVERRFQKAEGGKIYYLLSRIFPTYRYASAHFPGVEQHPWLYPLAFLPLTFYRAYRAIIRRNHIKEEIDQVWKKP